MEKLNVVVSLITEQNDYQREQAASAQAAAAKLGASVQIIYANNDAVHQTQQILQFIQEPSKRPDAIIVEPVGTGMPQVAKAAVAAGIAWGVVNSRVDYLEDLRRLSPLGSRRNRTHPGTTDCRHSWRRRLRAFYRWAGSRGCSQNANERHDGE
jgi:hypothetical protein